MFVDNMARALWVWMQKRVLAELPGLILDFFAISAIASISYGAWLAYKPAGFIIGGTISLVFICVFARRGSQTGAN
jgi:hypothetical protein